MINVNVWEKWISKKIFDFQHNYWIKLKARPFLKFLQTFIMIWVRKTLCQFSLLSLAIEIPSHSPCYSLFQLLPIKKKIDWTISHSCEGLMTMFLNVLNLQTTGFNFIGFFVNALLARKPLRLCILKSINSVQKVLSICC